MAELVEAAEATEEVIKLAFSSRSFGMGLVAGAAIGGAVAYVYLEKKMRLKMDAIIEAEVNEMREHYRSKEIARQEKPKLEAIVQEQGYVPPPIPAKETIIPVSDQEGEAIAEVVQQNVFEEHAETVVEEWDYESEVKFRSPEIPYVIHVDEIEEFPEIECVSWTYYEGDEVLVDAREQPVTEVNQTVGLENLDKFGHGSNDPNLVYIRNVKLGMEFEITRSEGRYDQEVLGLEHADESARRRKRVRFDDE